MSNIYESFAITLGESFNQSIEDFLSNGRTLSDGNESFRRGYLMGLHRAFTLMQQAAEANGISLETISLDMISEEDFLK